MPGPVDLPGADSGRAVRVVRHSAPVRPGRPRAALLPWWQYVLTVTGHVAQKDVADATGIDQSSISRWQHGTNTPRAEAVVTFARAYGRSPVAALVAAGYLSSDELGVVELTTLTGDLRGASVDSLLSEIRRRVLAGNPQDPQQWPPGWSSVETTVGRSKDGEQSGDLVG
jgi:transcriptional regulator with XRE-family HTH domain